MNDEARKNLDKLYSKKPQIEDITDIMHKKPDPQFKEGVKFDDAKARFDLIPPELLFAVADILSFGAAKYGDRNWEKGMDWGRCFAAMMRHMWAWWGAKGPTPKNFLLGDLDDETEKSHLWHAACCLSFLIAFEERGVGTDNRLSK